MDKLCKRVLQDNVIALVQELDAQCDKALPWFATRRTFLFGCDMCSDSVVFNHWFWKLNFGDAEPDDWQDFKRAGLVCEFWATAMEWKVDAKILPTGERTAASSSIW